MAVETALPSRSHVRSRRKTPRCVLIRGHRSSERRITLFDRERDDARVEQPQPVVPSPGARS